MFRLIFILCLIGNLLSCSIGGGPPPEDHFYRLPEIVVERQETKFNDIVIKPVKTTGLYHERAILYIESDKPLELQRYHYSFWSSTPSELVHNALYQGLKSSAISKQVSRNITEVRPDYIISTHVIHFERFVASDSVKVEVILEISVKSGESPGRSWTKRYSASETIDKKLVAESIPSFGKALKRITEQLLVDLGTDK